MNDFISASKRTIYLVTVRETYELFCQVLYQLLTSERLVIYLVNQSCLSKLYFKLWAKEESSKENCGVINEVMHIKHCKYAK